MSLNAQVSEEINYKDFLSDAGWGNATIEPLAADMGLRRYFLVKKDKQHALLMDMSRAGILEIGLPEFIKIDEFLRTNEVNAPKIYHHDSHNGLALIEYFGQTSFGDALKQGKDRRAIYRKATEILVKIKSAAKENTLNLVPYKKTLIWDRLPQFVDYYMPVASDCEASEKIHEEFQTVWKTIEASLPPCPNTMCLADYHLENLMWCDGQTPDYGVIDFQDAFWGAAPYDLLNLLEDARVSVPDEIKQEMKILYCANMSDEERAAFHDWYVMMSAQFHCRVIGLFIKFAKEGRGNQFLQHIPRLQNYLKDEIQNPVLKPLKDFIEGHSISFNQEIKL